MTRATGDNSNPIFRSTPRPSSLTASARSAGPCTTAFEAEIEERKRIRNGIEAGHYFLWEDTGKVVCLVGSTKETATERWIAPVYTPPSFRGKGYASALVAVASQWILDHGRKGMLFTDLSNPTSNSIYQKVGYRPLGDFRHLLFK